MGFPLSNIYKAPRQHDGATRKELSDVIGAPSRRGGAPDRRARPQRLHAVALPFGAIDARYTNNFQGLLAVRVWGQWKRHSQAFCCLLLSTVKRARLHG